VLKAIKDCTVNQLLNYRLSKLCEGQSADEELSLAICIFLESPRLRTMNFQERARTFRKFVKCLTPDVKNRIIDVE